MPNDNDWVLEFWKNKKKVKQASAQSGSSRPVISKSDKETIVVKRSKSEAFLKRIKGIGDRIVYVGIPAGSKTGRSNDIRALADKFTGLKASSKKKKKQFRKIARNNTLSNAQLLYLFSKGSGLRNQPGRAVLEPAILANGNREKIAALIAQSNQAFVDGDTKQSRDLLRKAGIVATKAAKDWFTDPRNNWAPNAASTIAHKGKDAPGLYTKAMRNAITHVEKDNK